MVSFQSFDRLDGLSSNQCSAWTQPGGWKMQDGTLWFPTSNGITVVNPEDLPANPLPPPVMVEEIVVDGKPVPLGGEVILAPGTDRIEFHYTGLSYVIPEKVRFRIKLEGYDPDWVEVGTARSYVYNNLAPKTYRFLVKACNNDGVWNETGANLAFTLRPRFYQTIWAYLLLTAVGAVGIYGGIRWRVRSLRQRNEQLETGIAERTAELSAFKLALQRTHNSVLITDAENRVVWANQGFTHSTQFTLEEVVGKPPDEFFRGPETNLEVFRNLQHAFENRQSLDTEIYNYRKDGSGYWANLSISPLFHLDGSFQGFIGIQTDVTERKRLETELARFALAVQQSLNCVMIIDREYCITWVNDGFTKLTQYTLEEVRGRSPGDFLNGPETDKRTIKFIRTKVALLEPFDCELCYHRKDGTPYWVSMTVTPLFNSRGEFDGFIVIQLEITHRKELEAALEKTVERLQGSQAEALELAKQARMSEQQAKEANRAKSTFLANMSHELRTPLNAILGFAQLMERAPHRSLEDREHLGVILRSGEHLLGLINNVLSISKIESGKLTLVAQPFDLSRLIQGIEEMFHIRASSKGLSLTVECTPDLPRTVSGDEGKIRQVLINLLGNAVKFTHQGRISLSVKWEQNQATFEVSDTGPGIAPEDQVHLFEPFVQTASGHQAKEGTGLGLAICKTYVELLRGDIGVESTPGQGTTFSFTIPLPATTALPSSVHNNRKVTKLAPGQPEIRILVVDDNPENRLLLSTLLTSVGCQVRQANDGREGVVEWQSWQPHLIWMDMRMPVMDGYEATRHIRAQSGELRARDSREEIAFSSLPKSLPAESNLELQPVSVTNSLNPKPQTLNPVIIALTASAFVHDRQAILAAGCDDLLTKPFLEGEIFEKMTLHLGVRFEYQEIPQQKVENSKETIVTSARLQQVDPQQIAALQKAMVAGNVKAANRVLDNLSQTDEPLALELRKMLKECKFEEVLEALESVGV